MSNWNTRTQVEYSLFLLHSCCIPGVPSLGPQSIPFINGQLISHENIFRYLSRCGYSVIYEHVMILIVMVMVMVTDESSSTPTNQRLSMPVGSRTKAVSQPRECSSTLKAARRQIFVKVLSWSWPLQNCNEKAYQLEIPDRGPRLACRVMLLLLDVFCSSFGSLPAKTMHPKMSSRTSWVRRWRSPCRLVGSVLPRSRSLCLCLSLYK